MKLPAEKTTMALGQFSIRCAAFLVGKGKALEGREFASVSDIEKLFLADIGRPEGGSSSSQVPQAAPKNAPGNAAAAAKAAPETVDQMQSQMFQMGKQGYKVDAHIVKKDPPKGVEEIYKIIATNETCLVAKLCIFHIQTEATEVEITYEELKTKWRLHKKKLAWKLDFANANPANSADWKLDAAKSVCTSQARLHYLKYSNHDKDVELWKDPTCVRACSDMDINKIKLAPASMNISTKWSGVHFRIGTYNEDDGQEARIYMNEQFTYKENPDENSKKRQWVSPFWHVQTTDSKNFNMDVEFTTKGTNGVKISLPILTNIKPVKKGEALIRSSKTL